MNLNKRQKIIITTIFLTLGLLSTQLVDFNLRFRFIAGFGILAYFLSLWALWEGINKTKAVILMILPVLYSLGFSSYYFVLPVRWLTRIPMALVFGITFYLLLLAQNIFNVAAIRTIPLYRAASTATFIFTLITALLFYNVIDSLNLIFLINGLIVFLVSFPLILQSLWSVDMNDTATKYLIFKSLLLSLIMGEFAIALSFWPPVATLITTMWALGLMTTLFVLVGLTIDILRNRLNKSGAMWYIGVGVTVFITTFLITSWTG